MVLALIASGIAAFALVLGLATTVHVLWLIAPVSVLGFFYGVMGGDTEFPALIWLYALIVNVWWSAWVVAGRALRQARINP